MWGGWDTDRVRQACRLLGETLEEFGYACCIRPVKIREMEKNDYFPGYVALLFWMREQDFLAARGLS